MSKPVGDYEAFAADFSQTRHYAWPEFDSIYAYFQRHNRVLDLGCGNARLRAFMNKELIPEGFYYGFDLSEKLLNIAKERNPKDHFFKGDFVDPLPFGADNFDQVVALASFHHICKKSEQLNCLSEVSRVLKPGGIFCATSWILPQKYFWPNVLRGRFKNFLVPYGPQKYPRTYRRMTEGEWKRLAKNQVLKYWK